MEEAIFQLESNFSEIVLPYINQSELRRDGVLGICEAEESISKHRHRRWFSLTREIENQSCQCNTELRFDRTRKINTQ